MAQQCFWSPFMFCRFRYSLVSCRVLIASVIRESVNFFCKETPALNNTFHQNFCMQMVQVTFVVVPFVAFYKFQQLW